MQLKIDLIPKSKKSKFTLVMGVISLLLPLVYLIGRKLENASLVNYTLPILVYLVLNGIIAILNGLGYSVEKIFGSAYVRIDNDRIVIKSGTRAKVQSVLWKQIKSLEYKSNWFEIIHTDGSSSKLILSDLEFKVLIETRNTIIFIAGEKGINLS